MGPSEREKRAVERIAERELQLFETLTRQAGEQIERARELQQPLVDLYQAILGGSREAVSRALSVPASQIGQTVRRTLEMIPQYVPAGPAREYATARALTEGQSQFAQLASQLWAQAAPSLAQLGSSQQWFGLQQLYGGQQASQLAQRAYESIMQAEALGKAGLMQGLGSLAQLGGLAWILRGGQPTGRTTGGITGG